MSSFLSWVSGTTNTPNFGKSIDLFLTQLETMPKLLDKRQSVSDLFDAIKEAPSEVPSSVIPRLIYVIGTGIDDEEILQKILDILLFLTELKMVENAEVLLIENVSTLLCEYQYVEVLLSLFDCPDVSVRISVIQILKNCIAVNQSIVEKSILGCPQGLQKLVDVLKDRREEVRNEMLLLLRSLTRRNDEICKFIAFQDGFDILISILIKEKGSISRDCLNIIYNMVVNSVLTLKLFSQKKYLTAIIDILSSYTHLVKSTDIALSPRSSDDNDILFANVMQIQDQVIDLTKYNELEILHNFDIQCFQFAISIIELLIKDEKYIDDEENYLIAKPILQQNRQVLHSYSVYIFDILYFTLYQLKEEPLEVLQDNIEEQHRNAYDLADVANQCESLLALIFTDSKTLSIFSDLLKITIFSNKGCYDLLSFLLNGFLESDINTVHSQGYYTNGSIFVRLFLLLFHSNAELQNYLIHTESESGNILKNTWIQCITHLFACNKEDDVYDEKMNQFKLILSVYKECCKKDSSSFMKLFIADVLTTELDNELSRSEAAQLLSADMEEKTTTDSKSVEVIQESDEMKPISESMEASTTELLCETPIPMADKEEMKTEEKSIKKKEKRCGEYLWILLTRLILSKSFSLDMKIELTELICFGIVNNSKKDDGIYNNIPFIMRLIDIVHETITQQTIYSPDFNTQLSCYCCLFLLLGFLQITEHGSQYIQLLDNKLGLEQICSLSMRFFFLTKVRQYISNDTYNSINAIGFDLSTIIAFNKVFESFKSTLFGFYLDIVVPTDETQVILDNYKQLIRIQDTQLQTFNLLKKGGDSGIEVIEELKKKDELIEELKKKEISLEQDVFDWKERFSKKEESLREKEQECEQHEYSLKNLQETTQKEKETLEQTIQDLQQSLQSSKDEYENYRNEKEHEINSFMVSLNKKQEQINMLDEVTKDYETTISELRSELQNNSSESQNNVNELRKQITTLRNELEASEDARTKLQKKWNTLKNDYDSLEDELMETKNGIMSMNQNKEAQYQAEMQKIRNNRDDLQIMVNELLEEKRELQELVRSLSLAEQATPTSPAPSITNEQGSAEAFFESAPVSE